MVALADANGAPPRCRQALMQLMGNQSRILVECDVSFMTSGKCVRSKAAQPFRRIRRLIRLSFSFFPLSNVRFYVFSPPPVVRRSEDVRLKMLDKPTLWTLCMSENDGGRLLALTVKGTNCYPSEMIVYQFSESPHPPSLPRWLHSSAAVGHYSEVVTWEPVEEGNTVSTAGQLAAEGGGGECMVLVGDRKWKQEVNMQEQRAVQCSVGVCRCDMRGADCSCTTMLLHYISTNYNPSACSDFCSNFSLRIHWPLSSQWCKYVIAAAGPLVCHHKCTGLCVISNVFRV